MAEIWAFLFLLLCLEFMPKGTLQETPLTQNAIGERRLLNDLLSDYDPRVRPVTNFSSPIDVGILFILTRIESLDERKQTLTSFGIIYLLWHDILLVWDPNDYNNTDRIVIPPKTIWMPEISVENSIQDLEDLALDSDFRVEVRNTGMVSWSPGFRWETSCEVDMTLFPYDIQTCTVSLINWVYGEKGIRLYKLDPGIWFGSYMKNGEWDIVKSTMVADYKKYESSDVLLPRAFFKLKLQRNPTFYNLFVLFPCICVFSVSMLTFHLPAEEQEKITLGVTVCLSYLLMIGTMAKTTPACENVPILALSMLTFLLPAESCEKITLGITVFLSYSFLIVIVADSTPQTGAQPRLANFIVLAMFLTALSLVQAIFTLRMFFHTPLQPVPPWVKKWFLDIIGPRLGFSMFIQKTRLRGLSVFRKLTGRGTAALDQSERKKSRAFAEIQEIPVVYTDSDEETDEIKKKISFLELEEILREVKKIVDVLNKQEYEVEEDKNERNWQMVSRVFDRLCMILFFVVCGILIAYNIIDLYLRFREADNDDNFEKL